MSGSQSADELLACLAATFSPDGATRHQAEAALSAWAQQEGFCLRLLGVVQSGAAADLRQLAAVVLRRHVERRWAPEDGSPAISDPEKAQVRATLPASLADANPRIQTAVGCAIAEIGKSDCPHQWPELLPGLVGAVSDKTNPVLVAGAVRTLGLLAEDLSEEQVVEMAPVVLPELQAIVSATTAPPVLRRWALNVFGTCLAALEASYKSVPAAAAVVSAALGPWLGAITEILSVPLSGDAPERWGLAFEALGCLTRVLRSFAKPAAPLLPPVLAACWAMFTSAEPLYEALIVRGEGDGGAGAEDDASLDRVSFEDLASQLFEALLTLVGSPRLMPLLKPAFPQLARIAVGFMQVGEEDAERWAADVNEYLSTEDNFWGTRTSGELLLEEMALEGKAEGLAAVADAVAGRAAEAAAARAAGAEGWWRLREASLLAAGAVSDRCLELKSRGKPLPPALDPEVAAQALLAEDLNPNSGAPPFVVGRALVLLQKWAPSLSPQTRAAAVRVAAQALAPTAPPLVQAGACQAFARLVRSGAAAEDLRAVSEPAFAGLVALLGAASEEMEFLVTGALAALTKADPEGAGRWAETLVPTALTAWMANVADPLLSEELEALLRAAAGSPGCLRALQTTALPPLLGVVSNPPGYPEIVITGSLGLLTLVLSASAPTEAAPLFQAAHAPVTLLLAQADDYDVVAEATAFLRTALQVGGAAALEWSGADAASGAAGFLGAVDAVLRFPDPAACRHVGGLILELLRHAQSFTASHLGHILVRVAQKLSTAEDAASISSLIGVLASVAVSDAGQLVEVLAGVDNGALLAAAMERWTERHMELSTPYEIKRSVAGLAALLTCPHPALNALTIKGKRVDTGAGIRTRSRSSKQAEQWSQVPIRVKIVMILADAYIESGLQRAQRDASGGAGGGLGGFEEEEYDFEDDDDEEGEEDSEEDDDWGDVPPLGGGGSVWDEYGMLADGGDGEEFDPFPVDPLEEARRRGDPLDSLDVAVFVASTFQGLAQAQPELMQAAAAQLTPTQVAAVQKIWG